MKKVNGKFSKWVLAPILASGLVLTMSATGPARADSTSDYQAALAAYKTALAQWKADQAKAVGDFKTALATWQDQNKNNQVTRKKANEDFAAAVAAARAIFQKAVADATAAHNAALAAIPTSAPKPVLTFTEVKPTPPAKPAAATAPQPAPSSTTSK